MEYNFLKYNLRKIDYLGAKYDTGSVMHYGAYAFSKVRNFIFKLTVHDLDKEVHG
jgi:hypothetical protein